MCDIVFALSDATACGSTLFGKNSDRPLGECQVVAYGPARSRASNRTTACSYVPVADDVAKLATVGCRPHWCWGYETGANEAGVVGGNTAIFTRALHLDDSRTALGLTGMELLRFGLERGATAEGAVEAIVALLERHGQWGSAVRGQDHEQGAYDNAFVLVDRKEAWVLETSAKRWIAQRVTAGARALSNQPTIRTRYDRASADIEGFARKAGWWPPYASRFDFALFYGDHTHHSRQVSHLRWRRATSLLQTHAGALDAARMSVFLRDHYEDTFLAGPQFHAFLPDFHTVCMHDAPSGFTWGDTATSLIAELDPEGEGWPWLWLAYGPPCCSAYLGPLSPEELPGALTRAGAAGLTARDPVTAPRDSFEARSLWWRLFRFARAIAEDPPRRAPEARARFNSIEADYFTASAGAACDPADRAAHQQTVGAQIEAVDHAIAELQHKWGLQT